MSQPVKPCTDPKCAICRADHIVDANKMVAAHSPDCAVALSARHAYSCGCDSAVVRAARKAMALWDYYRCYMGINMPYRVVDAMADLRNALSSPASPPPDAETCRCVGTRRYTDGKCDKCGKRIATEEPK